MKRIERRKLTLRIDALRRLTPPQIASVRGGMMDTGGASAQCLSEGFSCWDTCVCW
jgi:hypothetical protein